MFDLCGEIVFVNRAAVALYGFTDEETGGTVGALGTLFALYDLDGEPVAAAAYPAARPASPTPAWQSYLELPRGQVTVRRNRR